MAYRRLARNSPRAEANSAIACDTVQRNCIGWKSSQKYQEVSVFIFAGVPPEDFIIRSPMTGNATTMTGRSPMTGNATTVTGRSPMTRGQKIAFWLKKSYFGQSVLENGPPSSRMSTYRKTEGIQSYLRTWGRYDPIEWGLS